MPFVGEPKGMDGAQVAIAVRVANEMADSNGIMTVVASDRSKDCVMRDLQMHVGHPANATACASLTAGAAAVPRLCSYGLYTRSRS